jgi:methyl-accepting chemotaxis protein
MNWFQADAPIRLKMLLSYGVFVTLLGMVTLSSAVLPAAVALWVGLAATGVGVVLAHLFREAVCGPYVTTVVRMEALAAGDLDTPIAFTDYKDCVGRMTKAMGTFRATAQEQQKLNAEFEVNSQIIQRLSENFERMSNCDLTADIVEEYPPVYQPLKAAFNEALANLRTLLGSVMSSTNNIQTGSTEIAQAASDLARRTEGNAASLEQTSAAIQQVDARLKATARAATQSVETSEQAKTAVQAGRERTDVAVQAMTRVLDSAKGIDDVIEGLDKIAFQTRVLAMNAAVEAGRAGDAGRGFAVVADLVSALAMRAEEEAKRARDQLSVTRLDIGAAVDAVQEVDSAFGVILTSGEQAARLAEQIANDNAAQASAISEVSCAVHDMDTATQQNAAMVEQTSAAARTLNEVVVQLAEQADRFQVEPARRAYA